MDKILENIENILEKSYSLGTNLTVERFNLNFSKYTRNDFHFLVKNTEKAYFLKKYDLSHLKKVDAEVKAIKRINGIFNVPKIILSKKGANYIIHEDEIFVLYDYIDAPNLKADEESFFNTLCEINIKLYVPTSSYNFQQDVLTFEHQVTELEERAQEFSGYIAFLKQEMAKTKPCLLNLDIMKTFVHGDLLMQNLLLDKNGTLWVLDWENSKEHIMSVDIIRSILFTILDPSQENMNLDVETLVKWINFCFERMPLPKQELTNALNIFYFHLLTKIDLLIRIYIDGQKLNKNRISEDFFICMWFKEHKDEIQKRIKIY